jgi:type II secretory pathway component PulF
MYSVENPVFRDGMSGFDKLVHGPRFTGVGAQILGADDKYIFQFSEKSNDFWGSKLLVQPLRVFVLCCLFVLHFYSDKTLVRNLLAWLINLWHVEKGAKRKCTCKFAMTFAKFKLMFLS